jgi:hypothetical protein
VAERYLGQFTDENAELIVAAFEDVGIAWSAKTSGPLVRTIFAGDWGTRLSVRDDRADEAWDIAEAIAPHGVARRRRR